MDAFDDVEIYEAERLPLSRLIADINEKYSARSVNAQTMRELVTEMTDRAAELGFVVAVWPGHRIMRQIGQPVDDPDRLLEEDFTFRIVGRTDPEPFDHERYAREVKSGVADDWWNSWRKRQATAESKDENHG